MQFANKLALEKLEEGFKKTRIPMYLRPIIDEKWIIRVSVNVEKGAAHMQSEHDDNGVF